MFSKVVLDKLPPYCSYDYKIKLEPSTSLFYSLLYSQTTAKLCVLKEYLIKNLGKGFIESSQAP